MLVSFIIMCCGCKLTGVKQTLRTYGTASSRLQDIKLLGTIAPLIALRAVHLLSEHALTQLTHFIGSMGASCGDLNS